MPNGVDWLDDDHRPFREILGVTAGDFHKHCIPKSQSYPLEKYMPLVWFSVSTKKNIPENVFDVNLVFRVFIAGDSSVAHKTVFNRILSLFSGAKDGQVLWNACPLSARYCNSYEFVSEGEVKPTHLPDISKQELPFIGRVQMNLDLRGRIK